LNTADIPLWSAIRVNDRSVRQIRRLPRTAQDQKEVILFVLEENQLEIELLKTETTPINNTATSAINNPYSVTAMPSSFFQNR
jgi:hypothetical protein